MKIFEFIKSTKFFPKYAPGVTNWKHKKREKNSKGNHIEFTTDDLQKITAGMKKLFKDLMK